MKKVVIKLSFSVFVVLILIAVFAKVNTDIYIGDYSWDCCNIDIQIKIDDQLLLNDSLISCPYMVGHHLREKLKYGFHTVQVSSKKADINQEQKIFFLPNQYIYIEFFPPDTLSYIVEKMRVEGVVTPFAMTSAQIDSFVLGLGTIELTENEKPRFFITSRFNPFYLE